MGRTLCSWHRGTGTFGASCDTFQNDTYLVHEEATEDGAVALALISRPALVVIDSELSAGNGVRACIRLKEHRLTRDCKVVVISGHATLESRPVLVPGRDTFRGKPFSPLELIEIARAVCGSTASGAHRDGQRHVRRGSGQVLGAAKDPSLRRQ